MAASSAVLFALPFALLRPFAYAGIAVVIGGLIAAAGGVLALSFAAYATAIGAVPVPSLRRPTGPLTWWPAGRATTSAR